MKTARATGWEFLGYSSALALTAYLAFFVPTLVFVPDLWVTICHILGAICAVLSIISLLFSVWGLICGYSRSAWGQYDRRTAEVERKAAVRECRRQGYEPPDWMK